MFHKLSSADCFTTLFVDLHWSSWSNIYFTVRPTLQRRLQRGIKVVMNKLSFREHTKKMKHIPFLDAKWLPKSGTLWHDRLLLFTLMLNLYHHVQLACNLKTKTKLPFWYHWQCLHVFVSEKIHIENAAVKCHLLCLKRWQTQTLSAILTIAFAVEYIHSLRN